MQTITQEITEEVALCDDSGQLNRGALGWSRHPLHRCNLRGRFPRKKRWDYWCVMGDRFLFSATIANVDYTSLGSIYILEYDTRLFAEQTETHFVRGRVDMPPYVGGVIHFRDAALNMTFDAHDEAVHMQIASRNFAGSPLEAEFVIRRPETHETLNVVVPWNDRTFQFTSKQHCLPTEGAVRWKGETRSFARETSFACLDFGRGIWPYRTAWNWAAFSGRAGSDVVGLNMGAKWTDGTGMNENGIVVNGVLYKIFEDIDFEYDPRDFMKPWRMRTVGSDILDLHFEPFYEKTAKANLLLVASEVHQMFGRYRGRLRAGGREIAIDDIAGWAEEHRARW